MNSPISEFDQTPVQAAVTAAYDETSMVWLKGLEGVRMRPGMYAGDSGIRGMHHCVWEIIDNSVDEAVAGYGKVIRVTLHADNSVSVRDQGRGIPTSPHPETGISAATMAVTELHMGGKFGGDVYKRSGGLHGVGAAVANALAKRFELEIRREGKIFSQVFLNGGHPQGPLTVTGIASTADTGTYIRMWPDETVLKDAQDEEGEAIPLVYNPVTILERCRLMGFLNPGLAMVFVDETAADGPAEETICINSFGEFVTWLATQKGMTDAILPEPLTFAREVHHEKHNASVFVQVALMPYAEGKTAISSFANSITTPNEGTHVSGFYAALLRALNTYGKDSGIIKESEPLTGGDVQDGLAAAILVRVDEPRFEGQTKDKLTNPEARGTVQTAVYQFLTRYLEENPAQAKTWLSRCERARKARLAADRARALANNDKEDRGASKPIKLADCQLKDNEVTELYIVEGDSAGGSAKQGRDRKFQAILPLKGKILNGYKQTDEAVASKNDEIAALHGAIGFRYNRTLVSTITNAETQSLRNYGRIIIMTDADTDGAHIRTLLIGHFVKNCPELIQEGRLWIAMPPLYKVYDSKKKKDIFLQDDEAKQNFFAPETGRDPSKWAVQRFKGLGEMNPEQLWETTMNPETRMMGRVVFGEGGCETADATFELLLGKDVPPRRLFITENALNATNVDDGDE